MRILIFLLLGISTLGTPRAFAGDVLFPPSNENDCSNELPLLTWFGKGTSTACMSGQDFLRSTIRCFEGQQIVFSGDQFVCQDKEQVGVCTDDQVLSYTAHGFTCVRKTDDMPMCGESELLTHTSAGFQCVAFAGSANEPLLDTGWRSLNAYTLTFNSAVDLSNFKDVVLHVRSGASNAVYPMTPSSLHYYERGGADRSQVAGWITAVSPNAVAFTVVYDGTGLGPVFPGGGYVGRSGGYGAPNGYFQVRLIVR